MYLTFRRELQCPAATAEWNQLIFKTSDWQRIKLHFTLFGKLPYMAAAKEIFDEIYNGKDFSQQFSNKMTAKRSRLVALRILDDIYSELNFSNSHSFWCTLTLSMSIFILLGQISMSLNKNKNYYWTDIHTEMISWKLNFSFFVSIERQR